jgi:hypothetical protein
MMFILHAAYEGTYIRFVQNICLHLFIFKSAIHENRKKIYLTMVGGGVFGNNPSKIFDVILWAHKKWGGHPKSEIGVSHVQVGGKWGGRRRAESA